MDQAIVKIVVLMKNSYPQKNIFGLLANIREYWNLRKVVDFDLGPQHVVSSIVC